MEPPRGCKDLGDDIFLDCAQETGASWLATGNVRDFPVPGTALRL